MDYSTLKHDKSIFNKTPPYCKMLRVSSVFVMHVITSSETYQKNYNKGMDIANGYSVICLWYTPVIILFPELRSSALINVQRIRFAQVYSCFRLWFSLDDSFFFFNTLSTFRQEVNSQGEMFGSKWETISTYLSYPAALKSWSFRQPSSNIRFSRTAPL